MLASIIIPTKNEEDNIGRCLEAVFRQSADFPFEVLVIIPGRRTERWKLLESTPRA